MLGWTNTFRTGQSVHGCTNHNIAWGLEGKRRGGGGRRLKIRRIYVGSGRIKKVYFFSWQSHCNFFFMDSTASETGKCSWKSPHARMAKFLWKWHLLPKNGNLFGSVQPCLQSYVSIKASRKSSCECLVKYTYWQHDTVECKHRSPADRPGKTSRFVCSRFAVDPYRNILCVFVFKYVCPDISYWATFH